MRLSSRILLLAIAPAVLFAQMQMNLDQLAQFIRSELALKQHSDKQIAAYVKKISLTEKLTDKTIQDLEAQGAGPKTVQALQDLKTQSAGMKSGAPEATYSPSTAPQAPLPSGADAAGVRLSTRAAAPIPPPDSVRQQEILDQIRSYAENYTQNLPNFVCVEVMRRYIDFDSTDRYRSLGTVLAKVSYNEGKENYKIYSVNGHYQDTSIEKVGLGGGAVSSGEFGSLMREIFAPKSQAEFGWDHWGTLRGRRMAVFNYAIDSGHSDWSISYNDGGGEDQRIITAYKGLIYADEHTGEVARIVFTAVNIPSSFPVSAATERLDYDLTDINGQKYVTPLMAKLELTSGRQKTRNEIEFRDYRKFGTESSIQYEMSAPAPLPSSKTDEQPAAPQQQTPAQKSAPPPPTDSSPFGVPTAPPPPPQD